MALGWRNHESDREAYDTWPYKEVIARGDLYAGRWDEVVKCWKASGGGVKKKRLLAKVDSPVWQEFSAFGLPYPPFDQHLDLMVRNISEEEAQSLKLPCDTSIPPSLPEPAALTIDSEIVTLIVEANQGSRERVTFL